MEERLERVSQSCNRIRKAKNGEKRVPQRGLGVAQLEKLRMEEQQKQQQQGMGLIPRDHLNRQMKAAFQPLHPSPAAPFAMCLAGLNVKVPIHRTKNNSVLAESKSCVTHVSVAPDSMVVAAISPFHQGLGSEIYGSAAVNHHELRLFEPSLWSPSSLTELPMTSVSSCGVVQMEPPSNQIYSAKAANWSEEDKIPGRKRLWPFSEEIAIEPKSTKLELPNLDPIGIFRSSLETCFEPIQMAAQWQAKSEGVSPACKYPSEINFFCDSEQGHTQKVSCLGQAIVNDSCSSSSTSLMQPGFQLNWKGLCENDISPQEKKTPCDFLTLGLSTSVNGSLHRKPKEHSVTYDGKYSSTSDACEECGLENYLQQERSPEPGNPNMYQFGGLLKHRSTSAIDDRCGIPFYKLLCYESNSEGIAESVCQDNINKPADLDLRLSL